MCILIVEWSNIKYRQKSNIFFEKGISPIKAVISEPTDKLSNKLGSNKTFFSDQEKIQL